MNQEDWQARTRQFSGQIAAITGRDLKLWLFAFVVVLVLAAGVLLVGFSSLPSTGASRPALELATALVLVVALFTGYVLNKRHSYTKARGELIREIIYREKLQSLSLIDPLTQTFNICYLDQILPREINRANRQGTTITFVLIEPAGWAKAIEQSGELVGDQMLVETARLLKNTFRGSDIVLRHDISRFLVIMPETTEPQAGCALKRLLDRLDSWNLESSAPFELDLRAGMAAYARGADSNRVLKLAAERLQCGRPPAKADQPFRDLASSSLAADRGPGRQL
jgi:diguanylate cyclase (GGDEF)-like protein